MTNNINLHGVLCTENCGIIELSLLYTESDHHLVVNLHSVHDLPLELENSSSNLCFAIIVLTHENTGNFYYNAYTVT